MQHKNTQKAQIVLEILADILREERMKQNKSQRLLADEYDIQRSLFCRIEKGLNEPKLAKIEDRLPQDFSLIEQ